MRFSFLTDAHSLLIDIPQDDAVRESGVFVAAAKNTDDNGFFANLKGGHQAVACLAGMAGLHADGIFAVEFAILVHQLVGVDPGIALSADIRQVQAVIAHVLADDLIVQRQFCHPDHIVQAGVVGTHMVAVGIGKMGLLKAQFLGLAVHLRHKGPDCLFRRQGH